MTPDAGSTRLRLAAAFFLIYVVWGTTFYAIRIVLEYFRRCSPRRCDS